MTIVRVRLRFSRGVNVKCPTAVKYTVFFASTAALTYLLNYLIKSVKLERNTGLCVAKFSPL